MANIKPVYNNEDTNCSIYAGGDPEYYDNIREKNKCKEEFSKGCSTKNQKMEGQEKSLSLSYVAEKLLLHKPAAKKSHKLLMTR